MKENEDTCLAGPFIMNLDPRVVHRDAQLSHTMYNTRLLLYFVSPHRGKNEPGSIHFHPKSLAKPLNTYLSPYLSSWLPLCCGARKPSTSSLETSAANRG